MAALNDRKTAIHQLRKEGPRLSLDNLRRQLVASGELAQLRDEGRRLTPDKVAAAAQLCPSHRGNSGH